MYKIKTSGQILQKLLPRKNTTAFKWERKQSILPSVDIVMLTSIQFSLLSECKGDYPSQIPGNEVRPLTHSCSWNMIGKASVWFSTTSTILLKGVLKVYFLMNFHDFQILWSRTKYSCIEHSELTRNSLCCIKMLR